MYLACYISMEDEEHEGGEGTSWARQNTYSRPDMTAFSPPNAPIHK